MQPPAILIIDLEILPAQTAAGPAASSSGSSSGSSPISSRILQIGAFRPDTGERFESPRLRKATGLQAALSELQRLTAGADHVMGHNIIAHDLPVLQHAAPWLSLHGLPVIDTLRLSPLAFPQNPYHRLIKNYRIISSTRSSPLADCLACWTLYQDECAALGNLRTQAPQEAAVFRHLFGPLPDASGLPDVSNPLDTSGLRDEPGPMNASGLADTSRLPGTPGARPQILREETRRNPSTHTALAQAIRQMVQDDQPPGSGPPALRVCRLRLQRLLEHDLPDPALQIPLAYVLSWLKVSGSNSVLAPWVRHQFPDTARLIHELRDVPCAEPDCTWCRSRLDAIVQLQRYFPPIRSFREVRGIPGGQQAIVEAGMRGESLLAVLPTGGGKSLCFQLPALNRYERNGGLTVVVSPLQSLMLDQVHNLERRGIRGVATLNGMLDVVARADVLDRVALGDIGILFVAPEQFRNRSFIRAIEHRQINGWVFDEAHCLSKWGHDFRPDYLYAAQFIKRNRHAENAPVSCFTATGKPDVLEEIRQHFREELGIELTPFIGENTRDNLAYEVLETPREQKNQRIDELLHHALDHDPGGAVVFVASRRNAERTAAFLKQQGWACEHFHAGLPPNEKADIQQRFITGGPQGLRIIVATNAFGMGVDKPDVRLVVHAEIPGSLENYLQEAGRAGRDQQDARCVLLYDGQDIDTQFGLCKLSQLEWRDLKQVWKKLTQLQPTDRTGRRTAKKAARQGTAGNGAEEEDTSLAQDDSTGAATDIDADSPVRDAPNAPDEAESPALVVTGAEILRDTEAHMSFDSDDASADTKVKTALAWLARDGFLERTENQTRIFPARSGTLTDSLARQKIDAAGLPLRKRQKFQTLVDIIFNAPDDQPVSTDDLERATGCSFAELRGMLKELEDLGILVNDTRMTVYLRTDNVRPAEKTLRTLMALEEALWPLLHEHIPDADQGSWQNLSLGTLCSELRNRLEYRPGDLPDSRKQATKNIHAGSDGDGGSEHDADTQDARAAARAQASGRQAPLVPADLKHLLYSLAHDRAAEKSHSSGSLELQDMGNDMLRVRFRNSADSWTLLQERAALRRSLCGLILPFLVGKTGNVRSKDAVAETSFGELRALLEADMDLAAQIPDNNREALLKQALLFLHKQQVIRMSHGMTILRHAMTIRLDPGALASRRQYLRADYQPLELFYQEKRFQVHVMQEYAVKALKENIQTALALVNDYFQQPERAFRNTWFRGRFAELEEPISADTYRRITGELNEAQHAIVTDKTGRNRLVLAGPGSGKTRVIVRRVGFLLRVMHEDPASIIVLTFNRHAAVEVKRRLFDLVGDIARRVTVLTYDSMAMRLLGVRFDSFPLEEGEGTQGTGLQRENRQRHGSQKESPGAGQQARDGANRFELWCQQAADMLMAGEASQGEEDDTRDRLLAGFRWILVDEYQDISGPHYALVSALAGRQRTDEDSRLTILAVGDDDQNIYEFRRTSNEYIQRFREDYGIDQPDYLTWNYRSTRAIIGAANAVIEGQAGRMKADHPIVIDPARADDPPGGRWTQLDTGRQGRVRILQITESGTSQHVADNLQAQAVIAEIERLQACDPSIGWKDIAVLAHYNRSLQPLQAWCEQQGIPYAMSREKHARIRLVQLRPFVRLVEALGKRPATSDMADASAAPVTSSTAGTSTAPITPSTAGTSAAPVTSARGAAAATWRASDFIALVRQQPVDRRWQRYFQVMLRDFLMEHGESLDLLHQKSPDQEISGKESGHPASHVMAVSGTGTVDDHACGSGGSGGSGGSAGSAGSAGLDESGKRPEALRYTPQHLSIWLYGHAGELEELRAEGLFLGTVHSAKGLEFRHVFVLDGGWDEPAPDKQRLYYVAMTRAIETLTLCQYSPRHAWLGKLDRASAALPSGKREEPEKQADQKDPPAPDNPVERAEQTEPVAWIERVERHHTVRPELDTRYRILGLREMDIGYAGRQAGDNSTGTLSSETRRRLQVLAALQYGDPLQIRPSRDGTRYEFLSQGVVVSRSVERAKLGDMPWPLPKGTEAVVADLPVRHRSQVDPQWLHRHPEKLDRWTVVVPRVKIPAG